MLKIIVTIHKLCFSFNENKTLTFIAFIIYIIFGH